MRGAAQRCGRVVVASVLAAALSVTTGGAAAAAAGPPAGTAGPPAEGAARAAKPDRGPGFAPPVDRPAKNLKENLAAAAAAAKKQTGPKGAVKEEVASKRTATSRTVRDSVSGVLTTEVFAEAVHYRDAKGAWVPVDNTLAPVPGGAGWKNTANRFSATLPADLTGGEVRVADTAAPERFVALELDPDTETVADTETDADNETGAETAPDDAAEPTTQTAPTSAAAAPSPVVPAGDAVVEGAVVEYPDAAGAGVDVAYEVLGDGVKETVTLDGVGALGADGAVSFTVRTGKGLSPVLAGDVVTVVDAKGAPVFVVPAPFMDDAAGAHSEDVAVSLVPAGGGVHTLTLTPDPAWLAAQERVFPVVVDPTITYPSAIAGCSISSSAPMASACASSRLPVSWDTNGVQERALVRFDTLFDVVPADALVERAQLGLWPETVTGATGTSVDVRELTAPFTSGASWNTRNGTTAWATAGGDRAGVVSARKSLTANGTYQSLEVGELVSRWVEGSSAHHGFVVEKTAATAGGARLRLGTTQGTAPKLTIDWTVRAGVRKGNTAVVTEQVTDRTAITVNPATGNAAVTTSEYAITGVGLDLGLAHTSNSLTTEALGPLGYGWTTSAGGTRGVRLTVDPFAVNYTDGTGAKYVFHKAVDGSYVRPMGLDADLATGAGGTWTLTDRASKTVQTFTPIGGSAVGLSKVTDRNGHEITYTYDPTATYAFTSQRILRSVTDTRGRVLNITNPGYWNTTTKDVAGDRSTFYTVASNEMTSFTDAAGGTVAYTYDAAHRVTSVTTPEGQKATLTYDAIGRVTALTRVNTPSTGAGPTWEFTYTAFDRSGGAPAITTMVEDPNDNTTTYTSDGRGRTAKAVDARGKTRSATYSPNDDVATTTGAALAASGGAATSTNTFNPLTFTTASTRTPTGAGVQYTYGTGARLYDVQTATDAKGNPTTYTYNASGETSSVTRGGTTTRYLYQGDTDPAYGGTVNCGPTSGTTVTATKKGVLCEERDALYTPGAGALATTAHRTGYRYDTAGQLVTLVPPGTTPAGVASAGRGLQTFTYDAVSRLVSITDGNGKKTTYDQDDLDRLFYVKHADGTVESSYFTGDGPLRSIAEYASTGTRTRYTEYNRDLLMRLQDIDAPEGAIDFDYDAGGRMTMYEDTGGQVDYEYNAANQLVAVAEPGGNCTGQTYTTPGPASTKCILFAVDDDGRRTGVRYPGGATQTWALDDAGRTTRSIGTAGGTTRLDLGYTYTDPTIAANPSNPTKDTGLITSITDGVTARKTAYGYDTLDRLTTANTTPTAGGVSVEYEAFCYDAAGNRTKTYTAAGATCASPSPAMTATYDAANQMTAATGTTPTGTALSGSGFTYDGNGNQINAKAGPGRTTTYNDRDQATSTTPTGQATIPSTYAGTGNADRLTNGGTSFQSTPLSPAPGRSATGTTTTWTVRDNEGQLLSIRQGPTATPASATSYYPFTDQVGSVRTLVTTTGTVAATYAYTAYGLTEATTGTLTQPYQYGAGHTDTTTGLIKLSARYYDPTHGRFTQEDPSGQDPHYAYAYLAPIGLNDPTGLAAPNGCGSQGFTKRAPDFQFRANCDAHDVCYGSSTSRSTCDRRFTQANQTTCLKNGRTVVGTGACLAAGYTYGFIVTAGARGKYTGTGDAGPVTRPPLR